MTLLMEHEDVLAAPRRRWSPTVTAALWGGVLLLGLLIVAIATGADMPDAKTAARTTISALLGVLIVASALALIVLAVLRRSPLFVSLGIVVLLGGVGALATTLGLPEQMAGTVSAIDSLFALLGQLIDLLARLLDWILK